MSEYSVVGKSVERVDAEGKVTGSLKYLSDYTFPDMVWLKVLRAKHPHAKILKIDIEKASKMPGVVKILTHEDVPGLNAFGIAIQDMPVLCKDKVRYLGDAVAVVGAETPEKAIAAMEKIVIEYKELPLVTDPVEAMKPESPKVHKKGNILTECHHGKGDIEKGFEKADVIITGEYHTPRMEHAFIETECGVSFYDNEGFINVWAGGQYPQRDRTQIARTLKLKNEDVRVKCSPIGGGFGGKDEVTVQLYLALMTYHTKRPCKIVLDRSESIIAGTKRHPMILKYKTGCTRDGIITAWQAQIISDTGAYASLGGPVLHLAIEHACGMYNPKNTKLDGWAVYTNNGFSGAYRGFGATQTVVAVEAQMDQMADEIRMDRLQFRQKNVIHQNEYGGLNNFMPLSMGMEKVLKATAKNPLLKNKANLKRIPLSVPGYLRENLSRGIGFGANMQGCGLGVGIPDYAQVIVDIQQDGNPLIRVGGSEMGQGIMTVYTQIVSEEMQVPVESIDIILGDTHIGTDSGTSTASRSVYAVGRATLKAAMNLKEQCMIAAAKLWEVSPTKVIYEKGYVKHDRKKINLKDLIKNYPDLRGTGNFVFPTSDQELGEGLPHILYSSASHVAMVEVDTLTGEIKVLRLDAILDPGQVINPMGVESQSHGGVVMGEAYTLFEDVIIENGEFLNPRFSTYILPTAMDAPTEINTDIAPTLERSGPYGAKGIGESVTVSVSAAILSAIEDAIGIRFHRFPVTPEMVVDALDRKERHYL